MYTQPIADRDALLDGSVKFETQGSLCIDIADASSKKCLQLLGVAVLPAYSHKQLGTGMLMTVLTQI